MNGRGCWKMYRSGRVFIFKLLQEADGRLRQQSMQFGGQALLRSGSQDVIRKEGMEITVEKAGR
jgi:hypothetical protein